MSKLNQKTGSSSAKSSINPRIITISAMLVAIGTVLGFFKIPITSLVEIRFQSIPIEIGGAVFGPFIGGIIGMLTDVLSYIVRPTGAFFPGFTISSIITGVIFGIILHGKEPKLWRVFLAGLINMIVVSCLLNTLWLSILYSTPFTVSFISRLPKNLVMYPIDTIIFYAVIKSAKTAMNRFQISGARA